MVMREMSESNVNIEKDLTLNADSEVVNAAEAVENKSTQDNDEVAVDNQVENLEAAQEAIPEPVEKHEENAPAQDEAPNAEEQHQEPVAQEGEPENEEMHKVDYSSLDKAQLVAELENLLTQPVDSVKEQVAQIKAAFFAIRKEEVAKEKELSITNGEEEATFVAKEDELEGKLKGLLGDFKEKRRFSQGERSQMEPKRLELVDVVC